MTEEDIIPTQLKPKGDPYSDMVRSKQKGSSSNKRKVAQLLNSIPRMLPETIEKRSLELATNPETSAITIMQLISSLLKKADLPDTLKVKLIDSLIRAHTAIHGSKVVNKNLNLNANVGEELKNLLEATREGTGT